MPTTCCRAPHRTRRIRRHALAANGHDSSAIVIPTSHAADMMNEPHAMLTAPDYVLIVGFFAVMLGVGYYWTGRVDLSLEEYRKALELDPRSAQAWYSAIASRSASLIASY